MKTLYSLLVLAAIGLAAAYPAESQDVNPQPAVAAAAEPVELVQLVPVEEQSAVPESVDAEGQRSKRHLGFGGVGIGVGVGLVGGGFGGGYPGFGYGGGYPGYGYGGYYPGYGYGGYHRHGYRYGGYGYGGGFGHPYYF
uniref:Uncharacterized protein n=1 Tax=Anopheles christyi TaxID=43041 RepID=A0A182K0Y5_9DIPT